MLFREKIQTKMAIIFSISNREETIVVSRPLPSKHSLCSKKKEGRSAIIERDKKRLLRGEDSFPLRGFMNNKRMADAIEKTVVILNAIAESFLPDSPCEFQNGKRLQKPDVKLNEVEAER